MSTVRNKLLSREKVVRFLSSNGLLIVMLGVLVGAIVFAVRIGKNYGIEIFTKMGHITIIEILGLSLCSTLSYVMAVWVLISSSGFPITFGRAFLILHAGLSGNYVSPVKIGIPLRLYLYRELIGIPYSDGVALVALETITGILAPALIAAIGVTTCYPTIRWWLPVLIFAGIIFGLGILLYVPISSMLNWTPNGRGGKLIKKLITFLEATRDGIRKTNFWVVILLFSLFVANFVIHALRLNLVLGVLGYKENVMVVLFALAGSVAAGSVSLLPMGLGVRDASLLWFLLHAGMPKDIAILGAMAQRLLSPGWPLILGFISGNILGIKELKKKALSKPAERAN